MLEGIWEAFKEEVTPGWSVCIKGSVPAGRGTSSSQQAVPTTEGHYSSPHVGETASP